MDHARNGSDLRMAPFSDSDVIRGGCSVVCLSYFSSTLSHQTPNKEINLT